MTDLTLHEYYNIPKAKLGLILQTEARKMIHPNSLENDFKNIVNNLHPISQHKQKRTSSFLCYWKRIITSICYSYKV
jgi:hypothetical protein